MFTHIVGTLNSWVVSLCQLLALFVIITGIAKALIIYGRHIFTNSSSAICAFQGSRLELGYAFSLGLSFLVGGSILKTTITPSWNDLGQQYPALKAKRGGLGGSPHEPSLQEARGLR